MKRIIALLIALMLILSACGADTTSEKPATTAEPKLPTPSIDLEESEPKTNHRYNVIDRDTDGHVADVIGVAEPIQEFVPNYTYFYMVMAADEMPEERAAFRIQCDSNRYMDCGFEFEDWYASEFAEWEKQGSTWDYATFEGIIDYIEYQDGYTMTVIALPSVERRVIASFHGHMEFGTGDPVTTYGPMAISSYIDAEGNEVQCFAMEVMDYVSDYTRITMADRSPMHDDESYTARVSNEGPMDWSQIPQVCYDMWVGKDRVFGTGNGYWYHTTPTKAAGCPYTVRYWKYDPVYNYLSLGITFDQAGEGTYDGDHAVFTWLDFCDAHLLVRTSVEIDKERLSGNYVHEQVEYYALREAVSGFYGSTMFWPDGE